MRYAMIYGLYGIHDYDQPYLRVWNQTLPPVSYMRWVREEGIQVLGGGGDVQAHGRPGWINSAVTPGLCMTCGSCVNAQARGVNSSIWCEL